MKSDLGIQCQNDYEVVINLLSKVLQEYEPNIQIIKSKHIKIVNIISDQSLIRKLNMQHINSYIEYCNIVGDNGGIMMSEKEFQQYKKKHQALSENRLHTAWLNKDKQPCKNIGLSAKCFCDHLYKGHDYLAETGGNKVKCKTPGCKCSDYVYLPITGSQDFKCTCKHSYQNHDVAKKNCKNCPCKEFVSNWACSCGQKYSDHKTVSTRNAKGSLDSVHPTQGKITSFSSMLDRVDRHEQTIKQEVKKQGLKHCKTPTEIRKKCMVTLYNADRMAEMTSKKRIERKMIVIHLIKNEIKNSLKMQYLNQWNKIKNQMKGKAVIE